MFEVYKNHEVFGAHMNVEPFKQWDSEVEPKWLFEKNVYLDEEAESLLIKERNPSVRDGVDRRTDA